MTLNKKVSRPIYISQLFPGSQLSVRFALRPAVFESQPFWDKCTEWLQTDLKHKKVPNIISQPLPTPKLSPFRFMASRFQVTDHDESKIILTTIMSKVFHIHMTTTDSQISLHFTLRPAIFELHPISRWVHRMTPKWQRTLKAKGTPYMLQLPSTPKFNPFSSRAIRFRVKGHCETSALNDPKMTLNTKRSKISHICCVSIPESQISPHVILLYD